MQKSFGKNILTYFQKFSVKSFIFWSKNGWFYKILEKFKKKKKKSAKMENLGQSRPKNRFFCFFVWFFLCVWPKVPFAVTGHNQVLSGLRSRLGSPGRPGDSRLYATRPGTLLYRWDKFQGLRIWPVTCKPNIWSGSRNSALKKCISCCGVSDTEQIARKNPVQRLMFNEAKQLMC